MDNIEATRKEFEKCSISAMVVFEAAQKEFGDCCKNFPEIPEGLFYRRAHVQIEPDDVCNDTALHNFIVRLVRFLKGLKCPKKRFDVDLRWECEVLKGSVYYSHIETTRVSQLEFDKFKAPWLIECLETAVTRAGYFVQMLQAELWFYDLPINRLTCK